MPILFGMGLKKTLFYVGGLLLAVGGPFTLFSGSDFLGDMKRNWLPGSAATAGIAPDQTAAPLGPDALDGVSDPSLTPNMPIDPMPTPSLAEVLRFDATVPWVMQRWPRVSTGLPHLQLQGYRVPLVTGTSVTDLAGSLTYYFNAQQRVQRITLRGTTGDPRVLVAFLTNRYRFTRRLTNDPGVVLYEAVDSGNQPVGKARIRSASVVKANQPYARFEVDLVMDRPD